MNYSRVTGALLIALLAGGCRSVPVHYYTLAPASAGPPAGPAVDCCRINIASVKLPPAVDRPEIVVRRSDDQLLVLGNEVWIAPLRDEVKAALRTEIRRDLANPGRGGFQPQDPLTIHVDVERFESQPSQYALIQIAWRVIIPGLPHDLTASCQTLSQISVGDGVSALVHGYQRAISAIGAQIASGIQNLESIRANGCG